MILLYVLAGSWVVNFVILGGYASSVEKGGGRSGYLTCGFPTSRGKENLISTGYGLCGWGVDMVGG